MKLIKQIPSSPFLIAFLVLLVALTLMASSVPSQAAHLEASLEVETPPSTDPVLAGLAEQSEAYMTNLLALYEEGGDDGVFRAASAAMRFRNLTDDEELMSIDVPVNWTETDTGTWVHGGKEVGYFITASTNLEDFQETRTVPGVFFGVSSELFGEEKIQKLFNSEKKRLGRKKCRLKRRIRYQDAFFRGDYDFFERCNRKKGHTFLVTVATPTDNREYIVLLGINVAKKSDLKAVTRIFESFDILGDPSAAEQHSH